MHDPTIDRSGEPVPEADAIEQRELVDDRDDDVDERGDDVDERGERAVVEEMDGLPDDASEADAIEQATPVPGRGDDDAPR